PGGGGGGEEVALVLQIVQQSVRPGAGDLLFENFNKFLFAGHGIPSKAAQGRNCLTPLLYHKTGGGARPVPAKKRRPSRGGRGADGARAAARLRGMPGGVSLPPAPTPPGR